jgi:hypothetical protein
MTIQLVQQRLDALLADATPRVVLLTGEWGTGKSYQWKMALKRYQGATPKSIYVSLFGLAALGDLRRRIAEESIAAYEIPGVGKVGDMLFAGGWKLNPLYVWKVVQAFPAAARLDNLAQEMSFTRVRGGIVCLDDLERASSNLKLTDVLGLANQLKEERDCRVLLISNRSRLHKDEESVLRLYLEKVVDEQTELAPTVEEASAIAFGVAADTSTDHLRRRVAQLGISNIRVLRQLSQLTKQVTAIIEHMHPRVLDDAIQTLALFGACYLLSRPGLPTSEYLLKFEASWARYVGTSKDHVPTNEEKQHAQWDAFLQEYGYQVSSKLDIEIGKTVIRGFLDKPTLAAAAQQLSEQLSGEDLLGSLHNAISSYWHDLSVGSKQVVGRVFETAMAAAHVATLNAAYNAWHILSESSQPERAAEFLGRFLSVNQNRPAVFEEIYGHFQDNYKGEFEARVKAEAAKLKVLPSIEEALERIKPSVSWHSDDVAYVCTATVEDIRRALKTSGTHFRSRVKVLLDLKNLNGATADANKIAATTVLVLKQMFEADPIMAARFGDLIPAANPADANEGHS